MRRYTSLAFQGDPNGDWVKHSDYLALQSALREALKSWEWHISVHDIPSKKRITELRKQFLES